MKKQYKPEPIEFMHATLLDIFREEYPEDMQKINNLIAKAKQKTIDEYTGQSIRQGCIHNNMVGLCNDCLNEVDKF